jgi:ATP-dependent protease HslVU (ClpYQ) ATPase subunit
MEKLLEDISFNITDMKDQEKIRIDKEYVQEKFREKIQREDPDRYIL